MVVTVGVKADHQLSNEDPVGRPRHVQQLQTDTQAHDETHTHM